MIDNRPIQKLAELETRINDQEEAQAELLLNQIDIQTAQSSQDETSAEILLNQMEV